MSFCTFVLDLAVGWRQQGRRKVHHHAIKRQRPHSDERFTRKCRQMGGLVRDYQQTNTARCASSSRFLTKCPYYSFKMPLLFSYYSQNMSCHVHALNIISHENTLIIELLYCIIRNDHCTATLVILPFSSGGCSAGTIAFPPYQRIQRSCLH